MTKQETQALVRRAGGARLIARRLGLSSQAVYQWTQVPDKYVLEVERISQSFQREDKLVKHWELRPDIYPRPLNATGE